MFFYWQELREEGTRLFAVAIGDERMMDMSQLNKIVENPADVLQLKMAVSEDVLADQLLEKLCLWDTASSPSTLLS